MLNIVVLSVIQMSFIMLTVVILYPIILSAVMLYFIMLSAVSVSVTMVTVMASLMLTLASPFTFHSSLWKRVCDGKMLGARYHKVENQEVVWAKFLSLS